MSTRTAALDRVVFGVDIQSGDVRGDAPSYAVVAFDGDRFDRDVVSHRKLRRLLDREEPAILATDNAYELAADKDDLVRFLRSLPDETKLVQVTGDERPEPLSRVAARHGVPYDKKPMKEAEAAARLAAANVGHEVSAFTNTTELKVARGRSTGSGGWSEDRFTRRIHGSVKRRSREVESELKEAGLEYDREVTEKYGGYANALFRIEARPSEIPVSESRAGDTRVEIERVRRDGIEYDPLAKRRDRVLVGIDPGTTTAVAIVGLDGTVLDTISTRTADSAAVTEWIIERGRPILFAADVEGMPSTVEKFRRSFSAAGWTPESDLPVDEKQHRTRETGYENDHERDALAAALFAFDAYEDRFGRIGAKVPPRIETGDVIARVIAEDESVEAVLSDLAEDDGEDDTENGPEPRELTPEERRIKELEGRVERLDGHIDELNEEIEVKDERIADYEDELTTAKREERRAARERREVDRLEREIDRLEREHKEKDGRIEKLEARLERMSELWQLDHGDLAAFASTDGDGSLEPYETDGDRPEGSEDDLAPVKPIEKFTTEAIETAEERYGLSAEDVVLLHDASGAGESSARALAEYEPRLLLRDGGLSTAAEDTLFEAGVPVAPAGSVRMEEFDGISLVREEAIEEAIADYEERAENRRRERTDSMVDQLISEHRADRTESD